MPRGMFRSRSARGLAVVAAVASVALLASACGSSASKSKTSGSAGDSASAATSSAAPLSLGAVKSIVASGDPMIELAGLSQGFFKAQGLDVTPTRTTSGSSDVALLVGGSVQFMLGGSAAMIAKQAGAPVKIIMAVNKGSDETLVVSQKFATAHNIPTQATDTAGATAQLKALKGSHINIGVTNTTGDGYNYLVAALSANGITVGSGKDVTITSTGGAPQLVAAYTTGKVDAMSITPPYTAQADSIQIPLSLISPDSDSAFFYLLTTDSMISSHPDTVQAFVNGMVKSWQFATTNSTAAEAAVEPLYTQYIGDTPSDQQKDIFNQLKKGWSQLALAEPEFNATLKVVELAQPSQKLTLTYADTVDNSFVQKAMTTLHITAAPAPKSS